MTDAITGDRTMEIFGCDKGTASRIKGCAAQIAQALVTDWRMERRLFFRFVRDITYQPTAEEVEFWRSALDPHNFGGHSRQWRFCDSLSSLVRAHQDANLFMRDDAVDFIDYVSGLIRPG